MIRTIRFRSIATSGFATEQVLEQKRCVLMHILHFLIAFQRRYFLNHVSTSSCHSVNISSNSCRTLQLYTVIVHLNYLVILETFRYLVVGAWT